MLASHNSIFKQQTFHERGPIKKKVFFCHVMNGTGDFGHLLDLLKNKDKVLIGNGIDIIIESEHKKAETLEYFKIQLEKQGIKTIFVEEAQNFPDCFEDTPNPTAYIFTIKKSQNRYIGFIDDHKKNIELIQNKYSAAIHISQRANIKSKLEGMPQVLIEEHGGEPRESNPHELVMNLRSDTKSIFINQENRANPESQLQNILSKLDNKELKTALFGDKAEISIDNCKQFLEKNLFVPCYFQHNEFRFIDFLNIVQESPLSKKFDATTFFVNEIRIDLLEKACQIGVISKKILNITIYTPSGIIKIENPNAEEEAKPVKFIMDYRINDDDYNALFHCAQYFGGASGDKTLEKLLANGLIPLFIPHNISKKEFIDSAIQEFPIFKTLDFCLFHNPIYWKNPAFTKFVSEDQTIFYLLTNPSEEAKKIDESFFDSWKNVCEILRTKYNLHQKLPAIVSYSLILQEFMILVKKENVTAEQIISFINQLEQETLQEISKYYHNYFIKLFFDDKLFSAQTNHSQYKMIRIEHYLNDKFNPVKYLTFAKKLIKGKDNLALEKLELAKQCLNDFLIASNDRENTLFVSLNNKLETAFDNLMITTNYKPLNRR